jgi:hypothetical protein
MQAHAEDSAQGALGKVFFSNAGIGYDFIGFGCPSNASSIKHAEQQAHKEKVTANIYFNWHDLYSSSMMRHFEAGLR